MGGAGFEQTALAPSKTPIATQSGTESGTVESKNTPPHPDLALIQERWPKLPEHIRAVVLAPLGQSGVKSASLSRAEAAVDNAGRQVRHGWGSG